MGAFQFYLHIKNEANDNDDDDDDVIFISSNAQRMQMIGNWQLLMPIIVSVDCKDCSLKSLSA